MYAKWVQIAALELVHKHDMDEVEASLLAQGCSVQLTDRLLTFIPSAFAAEHYEPQGIAFSGEFFVGEQGHFQKLLYADEPVYLEARKLANLWQIEGRSSLIARILDWSAESAGIKEAISKGLTPTKSGPVHHGLSQ